MRRLAAVAVAVVCAAIAVWRTDVRRAVTAPDAPAPVASAPSSAAPSPGAVVSDNAAITRAVASHAHDVPVDGHGRVSRVLPDDNQGDRHQRFLVRLTSGESILIVHNIDIAPRVENLKVGDDVEFAGEFVWNEKGGLVHWTHHDPSRRHKAGWLKHGGRTYR
jgi:hypothetical protein